MGSHWDRNGTGKEDPRPNFHVAVFEVLVFFATILVVVLLFASMGGH